MLDILLINIGKLISKQLLKIWIKDETTLEVSSSLSDIILNEVPKILNRNRISSKFEDLGNIFAESINETISGFELTELEIEKLESCIKDTIISSNISAKVLVTLNFNPDSLEEYLLSKDTLSRRELYGSSSEIFKIIIKQISKCIIDISSKLPDFSERSIIELLSRESTILHQCENIISDLKDIKFALNNEQNSSLFEINYLKSISSRYSNVELYGADLNKEHKSQNINIAYISLNVTCENQDENAMSAERVLATQKNTLITGLAGSGKTTFLQWVAVRCANKDWRGKLSYLNECIPFFIKLRHIESKSLPTVEEFVKSSISSISSPTSSWAPQKLIDGKAIVLIDGVDELPITYRKEVKLWLTELVTLYPKSTFIVTSRPTAIQQGWLTKEGFLKAEIQDMDNQHIDEFIDHWHNAVRQEEDTHNPLPIDISCLSSSLKSKVKDNKPLQNLARTPLLCAMICALHKERNQQLPKDKIQLYDACIDMLLERRNVERHISDTDYPVISGRQKKLILQDLAYWLQFNNQTSEKTSTVIEKIENIKVNMDISYNAESILRLLLDRSGVIREPSNGHIDFTHKTFQEYFSALAIKEKDDIGFLASVSIKDTWYETILLASGIFSEKQIDKYINTILNIKSNKKDTKYLQLVALASLDSALISPPEIKNKAHKNIPNLVPPNNLTEAKVLSSAGDIAINFMGDLNTLKADKTISCIRTLALIGSELAFDKLSKIELESRKTVVNELIRSWSYFDTTNYAKKILLKHSKNIEFLSVNSKEQMTTLHYFSNLKVLSIRYEIETDDLKHINKLNNLERVDIDNAYNINNLNSIEENTCIKILCIWNISKNALSGIESLKNIKDVIIHCYWQADTSHIKNLKNLERLVVINCHTIDLSGLNSCNNIKYISINEFEEITNLNTTPTITQLNITRSKSSNLTFMKSLPNIESLQIEYFPNIKNLDHLSSLKSLSFLSITKSSTYFELEPLYQLRKLKTVYIPDLEMKTAGAWLDLVEEWKQENLTDMEMHSIADTYATQLDTYSNKVMTKDETFTKSNIDSIDEFFEFYDL